MSGFREGFSRGLRSKIGTQAQPGFVESPLKAMANRSNIIAQIKAAFASPERLKEIERLRKEDKSGADQKAFYDTYMIRDAEGAREATGAVLGTIAADIAGDGMRNIWWFINAPQALTQVATQQAIATGAGKTVQPLIEAAPLRMAATLPAVLGISMGMGQYGRAPGFKAAVPSEEDPRQTDDVVSEALTRYFLGRSGRLLPYDEFVKERPDVSPEEYRQYKNYLFSNQGVLKATDEGILGPEVAFMGKSIPISTALAPAVAGIIGAGVGARRGAQRFKNELNVKGDIARKRRNEIDNAITGEILKSGIAATAGTALAGQVLESIRRQMGSGDNE